MAFVYSINSMIIFIVSCFINCKKKKKFLNVVDAFLSKAWILLLLNKKNKICIL